jgi:hypothetical protein
MSNRTLGIVVFLVALAIWFGFIGSFYLIHIRTGNYPISRRSRAGESAAKLLTGQSETQTLRMPEPLRPAGQQAL